MLNTHKIRLVRKKCVYKVMIKTNVYFVINYITKKDTDLKLKKK